MALTTSPATAAGGFTPGAVYGTILNLRSHLEGLGDALQRPPYGKPPVAPVLYIKPPNTFRGDGALVPVPAEAAEVEVGATLAVVIGRAACRVSAAEAMEHVAGYAVAIDVTLPHASLHRPAIRQRCRDGFLPIGPALTPREKVADPDDLTVTVAVNGAERIRWSTSGLVRPVAQLIADVTDFMTLSAGDVLMVGLPPDGPRARVGDEVVAEIAGVGRLSCRLVAEAVQ